MSSAPKPVSVLLVDDRPENLLALKGILDAPEYRLVTAGSGREALDDVGREDFAVILLDVAMPGMTGFDVADHLKRDERTRHVPILFLTAIAIGADCVYRAYKGGAVDYLIKPLDIDAVRAKVAVFADLHRQRRAIEMRDELLREAEKREHAVRIAQLRAASDERYQKLVEGIDHAFGWTADADVRRLSFVSRRAQEILGYAPAAFLGEGFLLQHVHPDDRDATRRAFRSAVTEWRDQAMTHRLVAADGSARWFHTAVSAAVDPDTRQVELHGLSIDVTDLKDAEERQQQTATENTRLYWRAARAARARDELLQVVTHDLRTPLGSVLIGLASARAAIASGESPAEVGTALHRAECAARTMRRLVNDLVDLELVRTGRLSMNKQRQDVTTLLSDALALVEPLASARSITVRVESAGVRDASLLCDRDRLLQVLCNLLDNAIKFSPPAGTIVLAARSEEGQLRFSVSDEGPGMDAVQLAHVFERPWRARESARRRGALGLYIARGLVRAHEGRIWAESAPGKGSTFFFTMPAGEARGVSTTPEPEPPSPTAHV